MQDILILDNLQDIVNFLPKYKSLQRNLTRFLFHEKSLLIVEFKEKDSISAAFGYVYEDGHIYITYTYLPTDKIFKIIEEKIISDFSSTGKGVAVFNDIVKRKGYVHLDLSNMIHRSFYFTDDSIKDVIFKFYASSFMTDVDIFNYFPQNQYVKENILVNRTPKLPKREIKGGEVEFENFDKDNMIKKRDLNDKEITALFHSRDFFILSRLEGDYEDCEKYNLSYLKIYIKIGKAEQNGRLYFYAKNEEVLANYDKYMKDALYTLHDDLIFFFFQDFKF